MVKVLFVGESAPAGGTFFYAGNSQIFYALRDTLAPHLGPGDFLANFQAAGFFLDDLSLEPIDWQTASQRKWAHAANVASLATRLQVYRPQAVVALLKAIEPSVLDACRQAGLAIIPSAVPFPGNGQQAKFRRELGALLPGLLAIANGPFPMPATCGNLGAGNDCEPGSPARSRPSSMPTPRS
jgi:hypothetical protein